MRKNETPTEFKLRVIREIKAEIVYENNPFLLRKILEFYPEIIVRIP